MVSMVSPCISQFVFMEFGYVAPLQNLKVDTEMTETLNVTYNWESWPGLHPKRSRLWKSPASNPSFTSLTPSIHATLIDTCFKDLSISQNS